MSDDVEVPKILRDALAGMPATIESGLLSPRTNAIDRLTWVGLAIKVFHGPDVENKRGRPDFERRRAGAQEDP